MYNFHAILYLAILTVNAIGPKTEASKISSNARHLEGDGLKRRIAPRLVIRRIDAQVVTQHHIVIGKIYDTIVAVEIARQENHLHLLVLTIVHIVVFHHAQHVVVTHIVEPMRNLGHVQRRIIFFSALQSLLQVLAGLTYPTWHLDKGHHLLLQVAIAQQAIHGFYKHIDTLVAELITTRG